MCQADIWIASNQVEPGSSVVRFVVQPPSAVSAAMRAAGGDGVVASKKIVAWTRRLQEAAVMLHR